MVGRAVAAPPAGCRVRVSLSPHLRWIRRNPQFCVGPNYAFRPNNGVNPFLSGATNLDQSDDVRAAQPLHPFHAQVKLSDFKGRTVVLSFYRRADTTINSVGLR